MLTLAVAAMVLAAAALLGGSSPTAAAPSFGPTDVVDEFVAGGSWSTSASADFLPDGRLLVATTNGTIYLANPTNGSSGQHLLVPDVLASGEAGLLDIVVAPDFATTRYFYVYVVDRPTRRLRVDRFTFSESGPATLASRVQVWTSPGPPMGADDYHVGGSLNFGPDGMLYLSTGDNLVGASSQSLANVFGKVLRFRRDGTVPTDNPFYDGTGPNIDEIWALGIRNGFRSWFDPTTGDYWLGDVGGNNDSTAYEEVNLIVRGGNYGWPACEGPIGQPKVGVDCPAGTVAPVYAYPHDNPRGQAVVGGEVYRGSRFPSSFRGTYVYADYAAGGFYWLERNGTSVTSGLLATPSLAQGAPVWLGVSPVDGHLYWVNYGSRNGQLRRLRYTGAVANPPTITTSTASPTTGAAPLTVQFTGAATDSDGDPITYRWDFGDGTSASTPSSQHVYAANGQYSAQLTVTANGDVRTAAPITISVGTAPVATITSPPSPTTFRAGDTIVVAGEAADPDAGPVDPSRLAWLVEFVHNDHRHPVSTGTGASITIPVPSDSGHSWEGATGYQVTLTATDGDGLVGQDLLDLVPLKTLVPISADVAVPVTIDGITTPLPTGLDTAVGAQHDVSVPAEVCLDGLTRTFNTWSSGAPRLHTLTAVENNPPLQASYITGSPCGPTTYRAVNINGAAVNINGVPFEDGRTAVNVTSGPKRFCNQTIPLVPAPSAAEAEMIRCSVYGANSTTATITAVPNGDYTVEFWVWEDTTSVTFTPSINGTALLPMASGPAGSWKRVGPVPVTVTGNQIAITLAGGSANLSGILVNHAGPVGPPPADVTPPAVVTVSPANNATGVARTTAVTVTFSEPVAANGGVTLTTATGTGTPVPATVSASGSSVTLTPLTPLAANTRYRVNVSTAVQDAAGNALGAAFSSRFTTGP